MQQQNRNIYLHKGLANIKPRFPLCSLGKNLVNFSATIKIRLRILLLVSAGKFKRSDVKTVLLILMLLFI